jgi:hypothetical protein
MIAREARRNTEVRARVALAVRTSTRTVTDLLDGYQGQPTLAEKIREALAAEGVDLSTIPVRTGEELRAWKRIRQPNLRNALPEGYTVETCGCGREFPRATQAVSDRCWKCWWKVAQENQELRAENEGLNQRMAETTTRMK